MKRLTIFLILVGLLFLASDMAWSKIIYVDDDTVPPGDGTSWETAYTFLEDALMMASSGDEIRIAQGIYEPGDFVLSDRPNLGRAESFQLKNEVAVRGGFAGLGAADPNAYDVALYETILSGDIGTLNDPNDNCYHVFYHSEGANLDPNAVLEDCTITGGNADGSNPHYYGGGMYNYHSSPTVIHCTFSGNSATHGGGMYNLGTSSPLLTNCTFCDNMARSRGGGMYNNMGTSPILNECKFNGNMSIYDGGGMAGGMYNYNSNVSLINCSFTCNSAKYSGGGVIIYHCNPTLINCTFSNNTSRSESFGRGAGMSCINEASPTLLNCEFISNSAANGGGALHNTVWSNPTLINCSFNGNMAGQFGGGIWSRGNSNPTIINCILWDNEAPEGSQIAVMKVWDGSDPSTTTVCYSDVQGDQYSVHIGPDCTLYWGGNNLNANPLFKDADGPDNILGTEDDNLQLAYNSPCIDAGNNMAIPLDTTDLDGDGDTTERIPLDLAGHARFTDDPLTLDTGLADPPDYPNVVDMGAYERYEFCGDVNHPYPPGDVNHDCMYDLLDFALSAQYWLTYTGPE